MYTRRGGTFNFTKKKKKKKGPIGFSSQIHTRFLTVEGRVPSFVAGNQGATVLQSWIISFSVYFVDPVIGFSSFPGKPPEEDIKALIMIMSKNN